MRAMMVVLPPGGNGTTSVIGRARIVLRGCGRCQHRKRGQQSGASGAKR